MVQPRLLLQALSDVVVATLCLCAQPEQCEPRTASTTNICDGTRLLERLGTAALAFASEIKLRRCHKRQVFLIRPSGQHQASCVLDGARSVYMEDLHTRAKRASVKHAGDLTQWCACRAQQRLPLVDACRNG